MAKKADLLAQATELGLEVTTKNTIAELEAMIAKAPTLDTQIDDAPEAKAESESDTEEIFAKSGKRSKKAVEEAEAEELKKERVESDELEAPRPKNPAPKTRPLIERRSKKYKQAHAKIEADKVYTLTEGIEMALATSTTNFDSSVELHVRLEVDPRQADQNIRDSIVLPAGTGKEVRVAVFAEDDDVKSAKEAGADIAGNEDFLQQLDKEIIDFDVLVAAPNVMAKLSKYARLLGPKGLMPNPKSGTVSKDVAKAVSEAKAGKVEYRVDEAGIIHMPVGKVSFGATKIEQNIAAVVASIRGNKPSSVKGTFIASSFITTTMGPSIKTEL